MINPQSILANVYRVSDISIIKNYLMPELGIYLDSTNNESYRGREQLEEKLTCMITGCRKSRRLD